MKSRAAKGHFAHFASWSREGQRPVAASGSISFRSKYLAMRFSRSAVMRLAVMSESPPMVCRANGGKRPLSFKYITSAATC